MFEKQFSIFPPLKSCGSYCSQSCWSSANLYVTFAKILVLLRACVFGVDLFLSLPKRVEIMKLFVVGSGQAWAWRTSNYFALNYMNSFVWPEFRNQKKISLTSYILFVVVVAAAILPDDAFKTCGNSCQ